MGIRVFITAVIVVVGAASCAARLAPGEPPARVRSDPEKRAVDAVQARGRPTQEAPIRPADAGRRVLLVWTTGAWPPRFASRVARVPGVRTATAVSSGTLWLRSTQGAGGSIIDRAPTGYAIPMDVAAVDPGPYARIVGVVPDRVTRALRNGRAVLSRTSAALRRLGPGGVLAFANGRVRVGAIGSDVAVGAHEVVISRQWGRRLGMVAPTYLVARMDRAVDPDMVTARIRALAPSTGMRIRSGSQTPFLREADGVLPPEWEKAYFGEFAARSIGGGWLEVDPHWVARHVTTAHVPVLGAVRCNRALVRPLRHALQALVRAHAGSVVRRSEYGGCFVPRMIPGASELSHHSWGSAIDLNVATNPLGRPPDQDPRLVRAFTHAGFVWGGRFLRRDGMHFEYGCPGTFRIGTTRAVPVALPTLALCPSR